MTHSENKNTERQERTKKQNKKKMSSSIVVTDCVLSIKQGQVFLYQPWKIHIIYGSWCSFPNKSKKWSLTLCKQIREVWKLKL